MIMENALAAPTAIPAATSVPQAAPLRAPAQHGTGAESRHASPPGGGAAWDGQPEEGDGGLETARLTGQENGGNGADS